MIAQILGMLISGLCIICFPFICKEVVWIGWPILYCLCYVFCKVKKLLLHSFTIYNAPGWRMQNRIELHTIRTKELNRSYLRKSVSLKHISSNINLFYSSSFHLQNILLTILIFPKTSREFQIILALVYTMGHDSSGYWSRYVSWSALELRIK